MQVGRSDLGSLQLLYEQTLNMDYLLLATLWKHSDVVKTQCSWVLCRCYWRYWESRRWAPAGFTFTFSKPEFFGLIVLLTVLGSLPFATTENCIISPGYTVRGKSYPLPYQVTTIPSLCHTTVWIVVFTWAYVKWIRGNAWSCVVIRVAVVNYHVEHLTRAVWVQAMSEFAVIYCTTI